ncbi:MAG TPA: copper resistance protein CopC [bacterium]|nr:copper resistance protein CopC [bacterium]
MFSRGTTLALVTVLVIASPAGAHALLREATPASGAVLQKSPAAVTMTFTEEPEPTLSVVHVLDNAGRVVDRGGAQVVPENPRQLRVPLGPLLNGVYTVTWRTVSRVDGHVTGGAFGFGIGVSPGTVPAAQGRPPWPSPLYVISRWGWYLGLSGLLGAAWVWALAAHEPVMPSAGYLWMLWAFAAAGLVVLGLAQAADAGVGIGRLLGTPLGLALAWRALPLSIAGIAIGATQRLSIRSRRRALLIVGIGAAGAMLAHVLAGHPGAGAGPWRWPNIMDQWLHFAGIGIWVGGLAALLVAVRGRPDGDKAILVRRFSTGAGVALVVVAATGVLRAVDEVGSWGALLTSDFGQVVLVKAAFLLVLASLGAVNRYRSVPAATKTLRGLRRIGGTELGLAAVVLAVAGLLTGLAPPSLTGGAASAVSVVTATANDYATTIRVHLEVTPGVPGVNRFVAQITDYDTRRPIAAERVTLRFMAPARPDIGASTLELRRAADGTYQGQGVNISLDGPWLVTAVIERQRTAVEVPLAVTTRTPPQAVRILQTPGQPALYNIDLPGRRLLDAYLDPGKPGLNELHLTFINAAGGELPVPRFPQILAAGTGKVPLSLSARRFGPGHFIADARLTKGDWRIDVVVTTGSGETLRAHFTAHL